MVFSSLSFLFLFLPIVLIVYYFIDKKYANFWLLISSLIFYFIGDREHIILLISVIILCYISGLIMQKLENNKYKKIILSISIIILILLMFYFKYWNFIITNINLIFSKCYGINNIILPIGISFFIFQAISYIVDVYRGEKALTNFVDMALYISFFPQLIAGPIIRFHDIREYMEEKNRIINWQNFESGIWKFCIGLCKKVILANNLGGLASIVFNNGNIYQYSILYTWLGAIAYTFQIYYDFSGYSDMAIGLGKMFGFEFQENFNYPYIASSLKDFWRRWHISLSQFFRDYVYIPLGGNRCSKLRWIVNILVVWFLTGLWHGASWNYVIWGSIYGILLILEKFVSKNKEEKHNVFGHIYTMVTVIFLWVIFRTENIFVAFDYIKNMVGLGNHMIVDEAFIFQFKNFGFLLLIAILLSVPASVYFGKHYEKINENKLISGFKLITLICCTIISISYIYMGSYNPFLYFMF